MGVYCNFYIFRPNKRIPYREYYIHSRSVALFLQGLNIGIDSDEEYHLQKEHIDLLLKACEDHVLPRSPLTPPDERPISYENYLSLGVIRDYIGDGYTVICQVSE